MFLKWSNTYTGDSMRFYVLIFYMPLSMAFVPPQPHSLLSKTHTW